MRVCYVCADRGIPLDGHKGASAHVRGFVRALLGLGHDVRVLTPAPGQHPPADLPILRVPTPEVVSALPTTCPPPIARALGHLWTNVALERALLDAVSFAPQLVYERYSPFSVAGGLVARRLRIPHVLEVNAPLAWEGARYRKQALGEAAVALERTALETAPLVVAVSEELAERLRADGVDAGKILVVPNGVDRTLFTPTGPCTRPAPSDAVVVGFVGSLKAWHGLDVLAEAFRRLAPDPRFRLTVVGDGPLCGPLRELAAELPERVTLAGAVAHGEVPAWLRGMDMVVAPYPDDPDFYFSPLKVIEYMATGRAVVASAIGQLGQLVRSGGTGVLVPPGDPAALADALRALAADPELRARLGAAASAEAHARHGWERRVAQVLDRVTRLSRPPAPVVAEVPCFP